MQRTTTAPASSKAARNRCARCWWAWARCRAANWQANGTVLQGPSLRDLVAARDAALADKTTQQIAASVVAAEGIQAPFDREIIGGKDAPGRQRIQKTIDSLTQQSKDLVAAANAIGITKLTLVQP